jgi:hypothetical protein
MTTGHNFQRIANVDNEGTGLIRHVVPLFILTPDLKTRDGNREQQSGQAEVCVAVHAKALGCLLGFLLNGSEEGVTEVAFTGRTAVRLNIVPEVVIGQLQNTREKSEESAVD